MIKNEIINYFDMVADSWDDDMIKDSYKIDYILDCAGVKEGCTVLDVACGTGVLIPDYLKRGVKKVLGVDISSNMINIAKKKFIQYENVEFCCGDIEELEFSEKFDSVVVYNAFPHFCNPQGLIKSLSDKVKLNGKLTIAHGMGIEQLNKHHSGIKKKISNKLISTDEMQQFFNPYFDVFIKHFAEDIYIVSGKKH